MLRVFYIENLPTTSPSSSPTKNPTISGECAIFYPMSFYRGSYVDWVLYPNITLKYQVIAIWTYKVTHLAIFFKFIDLQFTVQAV